MIMTVHWGPYLGIPLQPVAPQELEQIERNWGVTLPEEYKALVFAYQGMAPEPAVFDVGRGTNVFNVLLTVKSHEGRETYSVARAYEVLKSGCGRRPEHAARRTRERRGARVRSIAASQQSERTRERRSMTCWPLSSFHLLPGRFMRTPMRDLQVASTLPLPMGSPAWRASA